MDDRRIAVIYQEYVVAPGLERTALLEALRTRCARAATVLYPGSSVHVTPSFYFQHVVYVDRSELSRGFFARPEAVRDVVRARKTYRQQPFVRFIEQDFATELPVPEASFDVLLALYAGGISRSCARYLKPGGLLLTSDHHGDARDAAGLPGFELQAVARERRGKVLFEEERLERYVAPAAPGRHPPKADYYLFRRAPRRR